MPKGVKITDLRVGTGTELQRGMSALADVRYFLNRGDEILRNEEFPRPWWIELEDRDSLIPGVRYGLPGMRVGGIREMVISPHLAFRDANWGQEVPANAVVRCVVELFDARNAWGEEAQVRVRRLNLTAGGRADEGVPYRFWMGGEMEEFCHGMVVRRLRDGSWSERGKGGSQFELPEQERIDLIAEALEILASHRDECVFHSHTTKDLTPECHGLIRETATGEPCVHILVNENRRKLVSYYLRESGEVWKSSGLRRQLDGILERPVRVFGDPPVEECPAVDETGG
ncbi:MAG: peptidylprolyl isomerase, FKBP-type [Akkermansiaceae bacterium]|nr:peptidylprolyl isomerase, FKBP-type [Akkermansiaceae bacterium]